jgi:hypothetical protein
MAVPVHSLVSLQAFKDRVLLQADDVGRDRLIGGILGGASRIVEDYCRGLFAWRGVIEDDDNIVASVAITNVALTLAGQPNAAGRCLRVTITDDAQALTAGRLTIVGTDLAGAALSDVVDFQRRESGLNWCSANVYKTVTSATVSAAAGTTSSTLIKIGTAKPITEYHSLECPGYPSVFTRWKNVIQVLELNEDTSRAYETGTVLAADEYTIDKRRGRLVRIAGGSSPVNFQYGHRVLRNIYTCGFALNPQRSNAPSTLADVVLELAILRWRQTERKMQGVSSVSDTAGNVTRFSTGDLTKGMKDELDAAGHMRVANFVTWEMDEEPVD